MAESPATWGPAEHIIDRAIKAAENANRHGIYGLSMAKQISEALKKSGLLLDAHWGQGEDGVHPCLCSLGVNHATSRVTTETVIGGMRGVPDLDLIGYMEDPYHGPSRPKTWRCWLGRCPHRRGNE